MHILKASPYSDSHPTLPEASKPTDAASSCDSCNSCETGKRLVHAWCTHSGGTKAEAEAKVCESGWPWAQSHHSTAFHPAHAQQRQGKRHAWH
jgi:hypothetical protein